MRSIYLLSSLDLFKDYINKTDTTYDEVIQSMIAAATTIRQDFMPNKVRDVVIEMCYQLGVSGFSRFKKTISYLKEKQFEKASKEMLDSRWAVQTPNRAKELSEIVASCEGAG